MIAMNMHETIIDSFGNRDFQAAFRTIDIEERNEYLQEYLSQIVNSNDGEQFNDIKYHYDGNGNAHLGAHFTPVADRVHSSSDKVKDGTIELGGKEINSGSVVLSVGDVTLSNEQLTNFEETANGYEISSFLDIKLDQVIYKGSETDVWSNELKELNNEATITLQLEKGVNGNEVVIVHEKHDGTYEIIPAVCNAETNTITFKTSSFSNYAIASKVASGQTMPTEVNKTNSVKPESAEDTTSPQTGDYSNLALWLAILCAGGVGVLGTTVYIKRKRRME